MNKKMVVLATLLGALLYLSGCAKMSAVSASRMVLVPESGKALVFLVRPPRTSSRSTVGEGADGVAAIYADDRFVGLLEPDTHLAVQLLPGTHVFMVVGESTNMLRAIVVGESPDFVRADLAADKSYYIKVEPKTALAMESRFLMEAHNGQFSSADLGAWTRTRQYEVNSRGLAWANTRADQVAQLKNRFFPKWEARMERDRREAEKHTLRPDSGR